ncbi:accessory gene regulator B family protein [Lachnospiraceae bacterium OttesenSCG-928-D06]|nr:accessory gene regulator B family protein [Lachnospiraceae bacterium OttesenSCG-928-D06]
MLMKKISSGILRWCADRGTIKKEQYCVISYGIELFLEMLLEIFLLLVLGIIFHRVEKVIIVLLTFSFMRAQAGGVHCKTAMKCFMGMLMICVSSIVCSEISIYISEVIFIGMLIYFMIMMFLYAPRNSIKNPIEDKNILRKKRKKCLVYSCGILIFIILCHNMELRWLITMPLFIEAITISPMFYKEQIHDSKFMTKGQDSSDENIEMREDCVCTRKKFIK